MYEQDMLCALEKTVIMDMKWQFTLIEQKNKVWSKNDKALLQSNFTHYNFGK